MIQIAFKIYPNTCNFSTSPDPKIMGLLGFNFLLEMSAHFPCILINYHKHNCIFNCFFDVFYKFIIQLILPFWTHKLRSYFSDKYTRVGFVVVFVCERLHTFPSINLKGDDSYKWICIIKTIREDIMKSIQVFECNFHTAEEKSVSY